MTTIIGKFTFEARYLVLAGVAAAGMGFVSPAMAAAPVTAGNACALDNDCQSARIFYLHHVSDRDHTVNIRDADDDPWTYSSSPKFADCTTDRNCGASSNNSTTGKDGGSYSR